MCSLDQFCRSPKCSIQYIRPSVCTYLSIWWYICATHAFGNTHTEYTHNYGNTQNTHICMGTCIHNTHNMETHIHNTHIQEHMSQHLYYEYEQTIQIHIHVNSRMVRSCYRVTASLLLVEPWWYSLQEYGLKLQHRSSSPSDWLREH